MSATCSRISDVSKSPIKFIVPVAQNWQPIAQPICEDTQTVVRDLWRMATLSTRWPSLSSMTSFVVCVSFDSATWASLDEKKSKILGGELTIPSAVWRPSMQCLRSFPLLHRRTRRHRSRNARITSLPAGPADGRRSRVLPRTAPALARRGRLARDRARPRRGGMVLCARCNAISSPLAGAKAMSALHTDREAAQ